MIIVTGANGFIGSWMIEKLNTEGFKNILVVDDFRLKKNHNYLKDLLFTEMLDLKNLEDYLLDVNDEIEFIIHLGAITDTTLDDEKLFDEYNLDYSKMIWRMCSNKQIPLIYASSAATYGNGENGFTVNSDQLSKLQPLNAYGRSKHEFDLWAVSQQSKPYYWAGLKFFNVYGPEREAHKGKMASMVYQIEKQIKDTGIVRLFKSYRSDIPHGEQKRDFIDVREVVNRIFSLISSRTSSGLINIGTGKPQTFNAIAEDLYVRHNIRTKITYIEMPLDLREKYQYHSCAE